MSRSNCAMPASIVAIIRPWGVSTSKVMPLIATTDTRQPDRRLSVSSRSWVERPQRLSRSEEHTSELQSLMRISYAVFCLKKKNKQQNKTPKQDIKQQNTTTQTT